jgi:endonuclease/exonuclease/phosphatase family metal-dependent hydrolase
MHRAPAKILALLFCCSLWSGCSTPTQSPDTLRVLSWNIHHGQGIDGALDLPRVAGIISSWEPDIVCLQEVDRRTIRSGGVDQAVELGYLLGMEAAFHRCIDHQGGEYGDAVLTKFKPRELRKLKLPGKNEQRGLVGVVIHLGGDPLLVCSTHFDHGRDNPSRLDEARIVADFARESLIPVILAGDLNALPESDVLSILDDVFEVPRHPAPTFPADIPERRIDYILSTHLPGWQLIETRVVPEPLASDHRPVLAIFKRIGS